MDEIRYNHRSMRKPGTSVYQRFLLHLNNVPYLRRFVIRLIKRNLQLSDSCSIGKGFCINTFNPPMLRVGENVFLNDTFIVAWAPVIIGTGTSFSFKNTIITSTHEYGDWSTVIGRPVVIGEYCWITTGVTILPGVTIGDHTVIGAGSVVTHDIPSGVLAAGNPCEVIREISFRKQDNNEPNHLD